MNVSNTTAATAAASFTKEQDSKQSGDYPTTTQAHEEHLSRATSTGSSVTTCSRMTNSSSGMFQFVDCIPFTAFPTLFPYAAEAGGDNNNMNANRSMLHSTTTGSSMGSLSFLLKSGDTNMSLMASSDSNNTTNNNRRLSFPEEASAFLAMYEQVLGNPSSQTTTTTTINNATANGIADDYTSNQSNIALPPLPMPLSLRGVSDPTATPQLNDANQIMMDSKPKGTVKAADKLPFITTTNNNSSNKLDKMVPCKKKRVPSYKVATTTCMKRGLSLQSAVKSTQDHSSNVLALPYPPRRILSKSGDGSTELSLNKEAVVQEEKDVD